jgi:hypothetical protein
MNERNNRKDEAVSNNNVKSMGISLIGTGTTLDRITTRNIIKSSFLNRTVDPGLLHGSRFMTNRDFPAKSSVVSREID